MKTLKKLTAVLLALTIALSICACSSQSNKNKSYVKATSTPKPSPTVFSIFSASDSEIESFICSGIASIGFYDEVYDLRYTLGTVKREKDCIKVYMTLYFYDEFGDRCNMWGREADRYSDTSKELIATIPDSIKSLSPGFYLSVDWDFR